MLTNQSLFRRRRRMRSSLWCVFLLLILSENQISAAQIRQLDADQRPLQRNRFGSRLRGLQRQQQQQQQVHVISKNNNDNHNDASSSSSLNLRNPPTTAPTVKIQDLVIRISKPKKPAPDDPKETTVVVQGDDSPAADEWTRYRDRSHQKSPALSPSSSTVDQQQQVISTDGLTTTPSSAPISAKNTPTLNHLQEEVIPLNNSNSSEANDDLENINSNDSNDDFIVIQSVKVDLKSNQNSIMKAEDIAIFEHVCETEFLPIYLPRVHAAATSYTDIKCIVVDQRMVNRSLLDESRILQAAQQSQPQRQQQQQQQIANVQLESDTFSTLLQILSTVNFLPADDSFRFTDIVVQTFLEYSYAFQEQLSQQTNYFVSQQQQQQQETGKQPESIQEEHPSTSANNNSLPVASKVGLGIGAFALLVVLVLFVPRMSRRRNGNENNEQNRSPAIVPVESLVSCIEPNEGGQSVSKKHNIIEEEEEGTEMPIDILADAMDILADDTNNTAVNNADMASQVLRRIMNEASKNPTTRNIGSNDNDSKPVEMIAVVGSRSLASDDISSVTQTSSIGSATNNNIHNNPVNELEVSSHSCVGDLLAQLEEMNPANKSNTRDEDSAGGGYPIPQIRNPPSISSNASSAMMFGGSGSNIIPAATTGSMLSLEWYSLADSLSSVVALTSKATSNLSSMLGDLTTNGDSASSTDDIIAFVDSGVETTLSGVVDDNNESHHDDNNNNDEAKQAN